jgi:hypothetical protein
VTCGREDQRPKLRDDKGFSDALEVIRGGPDSVEKLRRHVRRTHRAWCLSGVPLYGISVFCVLDDIGPASLRGILGSRLVTYRRVHVTTVGALREGGFLLLATGRRPHFTTVLASDEDRDLNRLLACLGPPQDNREHLAALRGPKGSRG